MTRERAQRSSSSRWLVVFSSLGILGGSALAGRAAVLVAPVALAGAIVLRAVGIDDPTVVVVALAVSVGLGALLLGLRPAVLYRPLSASSRSSS